MDHDAASPPGTREEIRWFMAFLSIPTTSTTQIDRCYLGTCSNLRYLTALVFCTGGTASRGISQHSGNELHSTCFVDFILKAKYPLTAYSTARRLDDVPEDATLLSNYTVAIDLGARIGTVCTSLSSGVRI